MKKTILYIFFLLTSVPGLQAQIQKGTLLLGGTGIYNRYAPKWESVKLYPKIGWALSRQLMLGLDSRLTFGANHELPNTVLFSASIVPGAFVRYYLPVSPKSPSKFRFFGETAYRSANYFEGTESSKIEYARYRNDKEWSILAGADLFVAQNFAIELGLSYFYRTYYDAKIYQITGQVGVQALLNPKPSKTSKK